MRLIRTDQIENLTSFITNLISTNSTTTKIKGGSSGTLVSGDINLLAGTNVTITQSGNNITFSSTNTTYSAGTAVLLTTGTDTSNRVWSAKDINEFANGIVTSLVTSTSATGVTNVATTNTNTFLNIVKDGRSVGSSTQISGAGSVTVTSDTAGKVTITGTNSTYSEISEVEMMLSTSSTARLISGRRLDYFANNKLFNKMFTKLETQSNRTSTGVFVASQLFNSPSVDQLGQIRITHPKLKNSDGSLNTTHSDYIIIYVSVYGNNDSATAYIGEFKLFYYLDGGVIRNEFPSSYLRGTYTTGSSNPAYNVYISDTGTAHNDNIILSIGLTNTNWRRNLVVLIDRVIVNGDTAHDEQWYKDWTIEPELNRTNVGVTNNTFTMVSDNTTYSVISEAYLDEMLVDNYANGDTGRLVSKNRLKKFGDNYPMGSSHKLVTPRKINGVDFDGTSDITITANPNTHNHDTLYLKLSGGTLTGDLNTNSFIKYTANDLGIKDMNNNIRFRFANLGTIIGGANQPIYLRPVSDTSQTNQVTIGTNGSITATSFIKSGGTSSEILMADGTTKTLTSISSDHTHTFDSITNKPTSVSGYGILDATLRSINGYAHSVLTADTRSTNLLPSTNYKSGAFFEFKTSTAIGLTTALNGSYSSLFTMAPYADNTGNTGSAFQLAQGNGNLMFRYWTTSWQPWSRILTDSDLYSAGTAALLTAGTDTANRVWSAKIINEFANGIVTSLVTSTTATGVTNVATTNTNTFLNIVKDGASVGSSTQISGAGSVTVTSDTAGKVTITGTNTTYSAGTVDLLTTGTDTSNRVWSASNLSTYVITKLNELSNETNIQKVLTNGNETSKNIIFTGDGSIISKAGETMINHFPYQKYLGASAVTGIISFTHSVANNTISTMFDVVIKMQSFQAKYIGEFRISFYFYNPNSNLSTATINSSGNVGYAQGNVPSKVVNVGIDRTNGKIHINLGATNTNWNAYTSITLERVETKFFGGLLDLWKDGWSHEILTATTGITLQSITMTDLNANTNTWRAIQVDGTQIVSSSSSTALNLISGTGIGLTYNGTNITFDSIAGTSSTLGAMKLFDSTIQTVAAGTPSTTASRTYGIQTNANGQMVVNVPWVDTNTTYSAGTAALLTAGTDTANRVWSAKIINDFANGIVTSLVTSTTATGVTNVATTNTNTFLNIVKDGASVGSSTQISGAGSVTVTSDTAGKVTITGSNTTYSEISEAEMMLDTSTTARLITGRRLDYYAENKTFANLFTKHTTQTNQTSASAFLASQFISSSSDQLGQIRIKHPKLKTSSGTLDTTHSDQIIIYVSVYSNNNSTAPILGEFKFYFYVDGGTIRTTPSSYLRGTYTTGISNPAYSAYISDTGSAHNDDFILSIGLTNTNWRRNLLVVIDRVVVNGSSAHDKQWYKDWAIEPELNKTNTGVTNLTLTLSSENSTYSIITDAEQLTVKNGTATSTTGRLISPLKIMQMINDAPLTSLNDNYIDTAIALPNATTQTAIIPLIEYKGVSGQSSNQQLIVDIYFFGDMVNTTATSDASNGKMQLSISDDGFYSYPKAIMTTDMDTSALLVTYTYNNKKYVGLELLTLDVGSAIKTVVIKGYSTSTDIVTNQETWFQPLWYATSIDNGFTSLIAEVYNSKLSYNYNHNVLLSATTSYWNNLYARLNLSVNSRLDVYGETRTKKLFVGEGTASTATGYTNEVVMSDGTLRPLSAFVNTTYSAGTAALLTAGTDTANRVWSAKIINDFANGIVTSLVTSTTATGVTNVATTNTNTFLNIVKDGASVGSSTQISGAGSVTVTSDTAGKVTITGTNTTYSAGTAALLTAGTDTANRVWSAKIINEFANGIVTSLVTSTTATGVTNVATTNTNTFLNIVKDGASVGSSTQISGAGSVTVTSDTAGKVTITGTNSTYSEISEAEINNKTSSTARLISGRRLEYISQNKVFKQLSFDSSSAVYKSAVFSGNQSNATANMVGFLRLRHPAPVSTSNNIIVEIDMKYYSRTNNSSTVYGKTKVSFNIVNGALNTTAATLRATTYVGYSNQISSCAVRILDGEIVVQYGAATTQWYRDLYVTIDNISIYGEGIDSTEWDSGKWTMDTIVNTTLSPVPTTISMTNDNATYAVITDAEQLTVEAGTATSTSGRIITPVKLDAMFQNSSMGSAKKLTTARKINGVDFDGTQDITITATAAAHNHDSLYLKLSGGTLTGNLSTKDILPSVTSGSSLGNSSYRWRNLVSVDVNLSGQLICPSIELYNGTPFIDFHHNNNSGDFTARIAEYDQHQLTFHTINGANFEGHVSGRYNENYTLGRPDRRWLNLYIKDVSTSFLNGLQISCGNTSVFNGTNATDVLWSGNAWGYGMKTLRCESASTDWFSQYGTIACFKTGDTQLQISSAPWNDVIIVSAGTNNNMWNRRLAYTINSVAISAPAFYESSLRKFKTNIKTFDKNALDLINDLTIVTFDRKPNEVDTTKFNEDELKKFNESYDRSNQKSIKNKIGIIADDSNEVFLSEEKDSVDLYKTSFVIAKSIQELSEENKLLKDEVKNLRNELDEIKNMIKSLM